MKIATGLQVDLAITHTFSAAKLIQERPPDSDTWDLIISDLERALKAASEVANELAMAEEGEGK